MSLQIIFLGMSALFCSSLCSLHLPNIKELSIEEKIGQLMVISFQGEELSSEVADMLQECHIGGVIYYTFANGLQKKEQVKNLSHQLHEVLPLIPPLIAIDQEGGKVSRLEGEFTRFPGQKAIAETKNLVNAGEIAFEMGKEMKEVGIHLNLSPVVDLASKYGILNSRCFSSQPEVVFLFAQTMIEGFHEAGVGSCLKHFPGQGRAKEDSHFSLPIIDCSLGDLEKSDLLPFKWLAQETDAVMIGHMEVPALDPIYSTSTSKAVVDYLRNSLLFKGLILTDSLLMEGFLKNYSSLEEGAVSALEAGCDLLLLGGRILIGKEKKELTLEKIYEVHQYLVDAVKQGRISEEQIDASIGRVFSFKERYLP